MQRPSKIKLNLNRKPKAGDYLLRVCILLVVYKKVGFTSSSSSTVQRYAVGIHPARVLRTYSLCSVEETCREATYSSTAEVDYCRTVRTSFRRARGGATAPGTILDRR